MPAPAQVQLARAQQDIYNAQLRAVCTKCVPCRWDSVAYDTIQLTLSDLAKLDAAHPGPGAQARIAAALWAATFDFTGASAPVSKARRSGRRVTLTASDPQGVPGSSFGSSSGEPGRVIRGRSRSSGRRRSPGARST
jgi:hypothetical protein